MAVCSNRTDTPGFWTPCFVALGKKPCACAAELEAELVDQAIREDDR